MPKIGGDPNDSCKEYSLVVMELVRLVVDHVHGYLVLVVRLEVLFFCSPLEESRRKLAW